MPMLGSDRAPFDELSTLDAPPGNMMMSPALTRTGGRESSPIAAQHDPEMTAWNEMMCSACGMTAAAMRGVGGLSPIQGELASISKLLVFVLWLVFCLLVCF